MSMTVVAIILILLFCCLLVIGVAIDGLIGVAIESARQWVRNIVLKELEQAIRARDEK